MLYLKKQKPLGFHSLSLIFIKGKIMFKNLRETIKALNADVRDVATCEKAKKLRKTLLSVGLTLAICGFAGVFVCLILFVTAGPDAFGPNGFTARIIVPFLLFIPCGLIGATGATLASFGLKIVITGYTANLIDETVGARCGNCGKTVNPDAVFCSACGAKIKKECPACKTVNDDSNNYCDNCGAKLN